MRPQPVPAPRRGPASIDGCRSADGRFEIVAEAKVKGPRPHGPNEREFVWKDNQTGATHLLPTAEQPGEEEKVRGLDVHKKRIIIFRKDGSIVKELGVADFLTGDEWMSMIVNFYYTSWLREYDGLKWKTTLKDPEKGRLSAFDPRTGKVTVVFDGKQDEKFHNPTGSAWHPGSNATRSPPASAGGFLWRNSPGPTALRAARTCAALWI